MGFFSSFDLHVYLGFTSKSVGFDFKFQFLFSVLSLFQVLISTFDFKSFDLHVFLFCLQICGKGDLN